MEDWLIFRHFTWEKSNNLKNKVHNLVGIFEI